MASKKRTWPRRVEAADPQHPPNRIGDRRDDEGQSSAKSSFPPSPRTEPQTAGGDTDGRDGGNRRSTHRPSATIDAKATNAGDHPGAEQSANISGNALGMPLRVMGQRIGTSTGGTLWLTWACGLLCSGIGQFV